MFAKQSGQLPFDVAPLRAMAYQLTAEGKTADLRTTKAELVKRLIEAKEAQNSAIDSPIFQLVEGFPEIDHTKTDVFRDRVKYSSHLKEQIACPQAGKRSTVEIGKATWGYQELGIWSGYRSFSLLSCCQSMVRNGKFG